MLDEPAFIIQFAFARGPGISRTWTWQELIEGDALPEWIFKTDPPRWLIEPEVQFHDEPIRIVCSANIPAGMEQAASDLLVGRRE
jgi:hypothetical protein